MTTDDPNTESHDSGDIDGLVSDVPAAQDTIGFDSYTNALAAFLLADETEPPLTVSIEGSWGTGKSSFMRQLRRRIEENGAVTVEFNAWQHESNKDLWAGFVRSFITQVVDSRDQPLGKVRSVIRLYRLRIRNEDNWVSLLTRLLLPLSLILIAVFALSVSDATLTALLSLFDLDQATVDLIVGSGSVFVALAAIVTLVGTVINSLWSPLRNGFVTAITGPDKDISKSFRAAVIDDFDQLTDAYLGDQTAYVFVDDLDRMAVPKAAELLREINLYLSDSSQIIFIFGMDREKVAAGLAASNEPVLPFLPESSSENISQEQKESNDARGLEFGLQYLEKFVQVPVRVPKPDPQSLSPLFEQTDSSDLDSSVDEFANPVATDSLRSLDSKAEGWQKLIYHISNLLENNPRKIKSFGNFYRFHGYLATQEELFNASPPLTAPQLAKYVALAIQYPQLATRLREHPDLIRQFEEYESSDEVDPLCEPWIHYDSVQALFQHEGDDEIGPSMLTERTLFQLSRVAPTVNPDPNSNRTNTKTVQEMASQGARYTFTDITTENITPEQERLYYDLQSPLRFADQFTIKRGASLNRSSTDGRNVTQTSHKENSYTLLTEKNIHPFHVETNNSEVIDTADSDITLENLNFLQGPMAVIRSKFTPSDGIVSGYIPEGVVIERDILALRDPEEQPGKIHAIVGLLQSKLILFYYLVDEKTSERAGATLSKKVIGNFPLPNKSSFEQLTGLVKEMEDIKDRKDQSPPSLMDFLGGYESGKKLSELGQPPSDLPSILAGTTTKYENLRIGSVSTERVEDTVQLQVTVRYRPEEPKETDTDQWGYTESERLTGLVFQNLDSGLADLIESFVPVVVEEGGGFAGFRSNATKQISPVDRLQEITLPAFADVEAGLSEYQQALEKYERIEQQKRDIQARIDQAVYDLYELSEEQIEVIEESFDQEIFN